MTANRQISARAGFVAKKEIRPTNIKIVALVAWWFIDDPL
jgi:hypothetical protein